MFLLENISLGKWFITSFAKNSALAITSEVTLVVWFLPEINSTISDKSFAVGIKGQTEGGWDVDFSNTYGQNSFVYTVVNTSNASLKAASPTNFSAGSHIFSQNTTNLDLSKYNEDFWSGLNLAFGAEYRVDNFEVFAGKENSYTTYDNNGIPTVGGVGGATNALGESLPGTSQVFGGFTPENATNKTRNSIGAYFDGGMFIEYGFGVSKDFNNNLGGFIQVSNWDGINYITPGFYIMF